MSNCPEDPCDLDAEARWARAMQTMGYDLRKPVGGDRRNRPLFASSDLSAGWMLIPSVLLFLVGLAISRALDIRSTIVAFPSRRRANRPSRAFDDHAQPPIASLAATKSGRAIGPE